MSGFLTTPWIIPQVLKQIEKIHKDQPICSVVGKFRAQIVKVFDYGDLDYIIELSDQIHSCKTFIPRELMQDYEEDRKTYLGLIGAFVLVKKFKFIGDSGRLEIILEQFEFCGLHGGLVVGNPKHINSARIDQLDRVNDLVEYLKKSTLDSAANVEEEIKSSTKLLDPPTPLKEIVHDSTQKFTGWDNFELEDEEVTISSEDQKILKAIVLPEPSQELKKSSAETAIFPVSTALEVPGPESLVQPEFGEMDEISDNALMKIDLDIQSNQSDDRMIDLVADSDEEERCRSETEDEEVKFRISQTFPSSDSKKPYDQSNVPKNCVITGSKYEDKSEIHHRIIKQASFTQLSDEELSDNDLDKNSVTNLPEVPETLVSQTPFCETLDLFSQSPASQIVQISQSDHGNDLFSQKDDDLSARIEKIDEMTGVPRNLPSDELNGCDESITSAGAKVSDNSVSNKKLDSNLIVENSGIGYSDTHPSESEIPLSPSNENELVIPAINNGLNYDAAFVIPKSSSSYSQKSLDLDNMDTSKNLPDFESPDIDNPFEDPENGDLPDFLSDEEEDIQVSPNSPLSSDESCSDDESIELLAEVKSKSIDAEYLHLNESVPLDVCPSPGNPFALETSCQSSSINQKSLLTHAISGEITAQSSDDESISPSQPVPSEDNLACTAEVQGPIQIANEGDLKFLEDNDANLCEPMNSDRSLQECAQSLSNLGEAICEGSGLFNVRHDFDMELSSATGEKPRMLVPEDKCESQDFDAFISRAFSSIFPEEDDQDPELDSFFTFMQNSSEIEDNDTNLLLQNILPAKPQLAPEENVVGAKLILRETEELDKENIVNHNIDAKPRRKSLGNVAVDLKFSQDAVNREIETSQFSEVGTPCSPQRFRTSEPIDHSLTDITCSTPTGSPKLTKNDLFVKVVNSRAYVRLSTPSVSISSSKASGPTGDTSLALAAGALQLMLEPVYPSTRRMKSVEKIAKLSLGMKAIQSAGNSSWKPINIIFPSRQRLSLSPFPGKRHLDLEASDYQKRRRTGL